MKVMVFGATGMVGQGVLRECLRDPDVDSVLVVGRTPTGRQHTKLREIQHDDFTDFSPIAREFAGQDACFFCLGISSMGTSEQEYRHITYDYTVAAGHMLAEQSPRATFVYVSGQGTDSTGQSRQMWARVKGETENALLAMPLKAYALRPGYIQPTHGTRSKTRLYRLVYAVTGPAYPLLRRLFPRYVTTTDRLGCAMLEIAKHGAAKHVLETADINALCP
jgi:uncharacterized protein YbjT (DUF2867 family)